MLEDTPAIGEDSPDTTSASPLPRPSEAPRAVAAPPDETPRDVETAPEADAPAPPADPAPADAASELLARHRAARTGSCYISGSHDPYRHLPLRARPSAPRLDGSHGR